jgi:hypothetical protein
MHRQELLAEVINAIGEQLMEVVFILFPKPVCERFKLYGFGIIVTARVDKMGKFR